MSRSIEPLPLMTLGVTMTWSVGHFSQRRWGSCDIISVNKTEVGSSWLWWTFLVVFNQQTDKADVVSRELFMQMRQNRQMTVTKKTFFRACRQVFNASCELHVSAAAAALFLCVRVCVCTQEAFGSDTNCLDLSTQSLAVHTTAGK